MEELESLLTKDIKEIETGLNPVRDYSRQAITYLMKSSGMSEADAKAKVLNILKQYIKNIPTIQFRHKNKNGDMETEELTITDYIKDVVANNEIIVPSFTTYHHPETMKSIHAEFMQSNVKKRSAYKKEAFRLKQEGKNDLAEYNNVMQKTMKIFNNSLSGAYSSKSSVLRNPSAHYTLTSITRCVSSIGNSISESFLAGNKHFKNANNVYNYITAIITNMHHNSVRLCIERYKLTIPSVDNIMDNIKECSKWYWKDDKSLEEIRNYLLTLTDEERVVVLYSNDFWNLAMLNENLIKEFFKNITKKLTDKNDTSYLKKIPEDIFILTKILCSKEIKGMNLDFDKLNGTDIGNLLTSTAMNIIRELQKFNILFRTFYLSNVMPIDIAYVKEMMRDVIILSDTDSTCATYDRWVRWYFGKPTIGEEGTNIAAVVMTLNSKAVDHGLKILGKNMNIPLDRIGLLKMKNEFYWEVFVTANVNKHYFASTLIQEGNVYKAPELELKGVHLISSAASPEYVKKVHNMIKEITEKLARGEKLSLIEYVTAVADMERDIISRIDNGDITIFRNERIKSAESYKNDDINLTPYIYHVMWKDVFSSKYGYPGEPPYGVIKIPTTINSKKEMSSYLDKIEDEDIKKKMTEFCVTYKKEYLGTFKPPMAIVGVNGIPKEMMLAVDKSRIVIDNMMSAYTVLEALGFYRKSDKLITELGY